MDSYGLFKKVFSFEKAERVPAIEWASWWDKTVAGWCEEGLPHEVTEGTDLMRYFGLDVHKQFWISARGAGAPTPPAHGKGILQEVSMDGYLAVKEYLYPAECIQKELIQQWAEQRKKGEAFVWITLEGFFWHPREIIGIEEHLYAFYDQPELMHAINEDLLNFNLRALDAFCDICIPDFMTFAEDLSYNKGPMISKDIFQTFLQPYYKKIVPRLKEYGIDVIVDSDGDITELVPWYEEVDIHGFLPLERQAGVDVNELRRDYPKLKIIGGFDKMVMHQGEEAMRREFERLFPVMKAGGFIPSCDHQTPPQVSLENYRLYVRLLQEYCKKAMQ